MRTWFWPLIVPSVICGCAMFGMWRAIPPPGGCDRCHTLQISHDWQVAYSPPFLTDETDRRHWQEPESVLPPEESPLAVQKVTEERCFRCHKSPSKAHAEYRGRYHH